MEYEMQDDPQGHDGEPDTPDYNDRSELIEEHRATMNQGETTPEKYPKEKRAESTALHGSLAKDEAKDKKAD